MLDILLCAVATIANTRSSKLNLLRIQVQFSCCVWLLTFSFFFRLFFYSYFSLHRYCILFYWTIIPSLSYGPEISVKLNSWKIFFCYKSTYFPVPSWLTWRQTWFQIYRDKLREHEPNSDTSMKLSHQSQQKALLFNKTLTLESLLVEKFCSRPSGDTHKSAEKENFIYVNFRVLNNFTIFPDLVRNYYYKNLTKFVHI